MKSIAQVSRWSACVLLLGLAGIAMAQTIQPKPEPEPQPRNFDARVALLGEKPFIPDTAQDQALSGLSRQVADLAVSFSAATGATRTLFNRGGYLSPAADDAEPFDVALDFVENNLAAFGLESADLANAEVVDEVYSVVTGATHLYLQQHFQGIPVYNGQLNVNVNRQGRIISVNNTFMPKASSAVSNEIKPVLHQQKALFLAASDARLGVREMPLFQTRPLGVTREVSISAPAISSEPVKMSLAWLPIAQGEMRLVWNFRIHTPAGDHVYDYCVDAADGKIWTRFDWIAAEDYRVLPRPIESPNHTSPLPPADARQVIIDPADSEAAPFGWHDTDGAAGAEFTITRGNSTHAYVDAFNNGSPSSAEPDGGAGLSFDEPFDLTQDPQEYEDAAVVELFYWSNIIHDVLWHYGFDEVGGNFQENNYGRGGLGGDYVRAEAHDGRDIGNSDNAFFFTPPDGSRPRMEMYVFTATNPRRDGDFDHGIIAHEYGHGISNRLVGGPSNVSCLNNGQQPGEGISDWFALVFTHAEGQTGATPRGMGTYALGQPIDGSGIRPQRYSTDPGINSYTYESIRNFSGVHSIGSVWAQIAWEAYWSLVDVHGFDVDLYNAAGTAGNQRMLLYMIEGFKNTVCSPTFIDVRDGIIQAATDNHGGEDVCTLWEAFANIGLGVDAVSPNNNTNQVTNGFSVPASCLCTPPAAPSGLAGETQGSDVTLSWSGTADSYSILRADGTCAEGVFEEIASGITENSFTDTNTEVAQTYSYKVVAYGAGGACSTESSCSEVTTCGSLLQLAPFWGENVSILQIMECVF